MNELTAAYTALKYVFKEKNFITIFIVLSVFFIASYTFLSSLLESYGKTVFSIASFSIFDYVILVSLGLLTSLLILLQIFIFIYNKTPRINAVEKSVVSIVLLLPTTILSVCNQCSYSAVSFLGSDGALFLSEYKMYFIYSGIALTIVTLYTSILNLQGYCNTCKV